MKTIYMESKDIGFHLDKPTMRITDDFVRVGVSDRLTDYEVKSIDILLAKHQDKILEYGDRLKVVEKQRDVYLTALKLLLNSSYLSGIEFDKLIELARIDVEADMKQEDN